MDSSLNVVENKGGVNILPAIIDGVSRKIGQLEKAFKDKKTGFNAPSFAVNFAEMRPGKSLFVEQRGQQNFNFSAWQYDANKPIGNGGIQVNRNAQFA